MPGDPYLPRLDDFTMTPDETALVKKALATAKPWEFVPDEAGDVALLRSLKDRILALHLERHGWTCCYCRTNLKGAGPFMTDREHVLPKGKPRYRPLSYALWNLSAACKRCNMQFKRGGDAFVAPDADASALRTSEAYRFVHPNLDAWDEHLSRLSVQVNTRTIVKIVRRGGEKAEYAYEFFHLKDLEVDSFDTAQGLDNGAVETAAVLELRRLAEVFAQ